MRPTTRRSLLPLLAALTLAACTSDTPATAPDDRAAATAYAAQLTRTANALRERIVSARFHALVALDSLPADAPGRQRVSVEVRALARLADSLSVVTAQADAFRATAGGR